MADNLTKITWNDPEKKAAQITTWLTVGGIATVAFMFWGTIVPFVLSTVRDTFWISIYLGGLAVVAWLATNSRFTRALNSY